VIKSEPEVGRALHSSMVRKLGLKDQLAITLAKSGIVVWIVVLGAILAVVTPRFLTTMNLLIVLTQSSIIAIMAVGMTFVIVSAGIDLSVGSVAGFASITMGMMLISQAMYRDRVALMHLNQAPLELVRAVVVALAVAGACGAVNGVLIAYARLPPFIATLGMAGMARGVAAYVSAGYPAYGLPDAIGFIGQGQIAGIPMPVILMVGIALIGHFVLTSTTFGARVYAIGGNPSAAYLSGVNVRLTQLTIYTLNGVLAGVGAVVLSARANLAHPDAAIGYELFVIGAVVMGGTSLMGGKGGVIGAVLGAILMAEVQNGINLLDIPVNFMQPILGVVIVLAVYWDQLQKGNRSGG
jgi:ribose transport system permease protein